MSIDDERVKFYLRNRAQIEQWAALGESAASALHTWMCALTTTMEALRAKLGADVQLQPNLDEGSLWPNFRFVKQSWGPAAGEPAAALSLEWTRRRGSRPEDRFRPYVGIRAVNSAAAGVALRASSEMTAVRQRRGDRTNPWWLAVTYQPVPSEFPDAADAYRSQLVDALEKCWTDYSGAITSVLAPPSGT
jgi:hypothetical protein